MEIVSHRKVSQVLFSPLFFFLFRSSFFRHSSLSCLFLFLSLHAIIHHNIRCNILKTTYPSHKLSYHLHLSISIIVHHAPRKLCQNPRRYVPSRVIHLFSFVSRSLRSFSHLFGLNTYRKQSPRARPGRGRAVRAAPSQPYPIPHLTSHFISTPPPPSFSPLSFSHKQAQCTINTLHRQKILKWRDKRQNL